LPAVLFCCRILQRSITAADEAEFGALGKLRNIFKTKPNQQPNAHTSRRPACNVQITDTDALADTNWAGVTAPPPAAAATATAGTYYASAGYLPLTSDVVWPHRSVGPNSR
jgi:hypothetical protein